MPTKLSGKGGKGSSDKGNRRDCVSDRSQERTEIDRKKYTTASIRKKHPEYYPREDDPQAFQDFLETERTYQAANPARRGFDEGRREQTTRENRDADYERRQSAVQTRDFAYSQGHELHHGYETANNLRDDPQQEDGPGAQDYYDLEIEQPYNDAMVASCPEPISEQGRASGQEQSSRRGERRPKPKKRVSWTEKVKVKRFEDQNF